MENIRTNIFDEYKKEVFIIFILLLGNVMAAEANAEDSDKSVKEKTNEVFAGKIVVPPFLAGIGKGIFGIKENEVTLQDFIIHLVIWFFLFLIVSEALSLTSFFDGWKKWAGGAIVTILVGTTGAINEGTTFLLSLFNFYEKWKAVYVIFLALALLILGFGAAKLLEILRKNSRKNKALFTGLKLGLSTKKNP